MEAAILLGFLALAIPFVLPIVALVRAGSAHRRAADLDRRLAEQAATIERLKREMAALKATIAEPPLSPARTAPATEAPRAAMAGEPPLTPSGAAARPPAQPPSTLPPPAPPQLAPPLSVLPASAPPRSAPSAPAEPPASLVAPAISRTESPRPEPLHPASPRSEPPRVAPPQRTLPPEPPAEPQPPRAPAFDLERLVGVRLFSAVAGLALVVAAVLFLRYSVEHGWLGPTVRFAIGLLVGVGLLVVCEARAARRYPVTANALDAAAIAILFSTFFAAHAMWHLIPTLAAFGCLALVALLAVLLSIRRDSVFIAVLGLLGGFATPALLSTGENQPIPLFTYLLLLNVGLGWLGYRKGWPALTWLSVVLTAVYQWGWVFTFLTTGQLPLATGIFLVFPIVAVALRVLLLPHRVGREGAGEAPGGSVPDRAGLAAALGAAMPLAFAVFLAAVPAYGASATLLFGFLLVVNLGLTALAIAEGRWLYHATGGLVTLVVFAAWLNVSYRGEAWPEVLVWLAVFVVLFATAGSLARVRGAVPDGVEGAGALAAAVLLFVPTALVGVEPAVSSPWPLFGVVLALLVFLAAVAVWRRHGWVYFIAAFLAVSAVAAWSVRYLAPARLGSALVVYGLFALIALAAPIAARRLGRPFEPVWGSGAVLVAGIGLMLLLTRGDVAPSAWWGLGLLLVVLNGSLFVESAACKRSWHLAAGSALSWVVLATWWETGAAAVPVSLSLGVAVTLALLFLAGHVWQRRRAGDCAPTPDWRPVLGLPVYLLLAATASQPSLALPPWPLFAAMVVLLLGFSAASLAAREPALHGGSVVAAACVVLVWSASATAAPWPALAVAAALAVLGYGLAWVTAAGDPSRDVRQMTPGAAAIAAGIAALAVMSAGTQPGAPGAWLPAAAQTSVVVALLWLGVRTGWTPLTLVALGTSTMAAWVWQDQHRAPAEWWHGLAMAGLPYLAFLAFPFAAARRIPGSRLPHVAAVAASAAFFVLGRVALERGGLGHVIGLLPVAEAACLALLVRQLLTLEDAGSRDEGRLALVAGAALALVTVAIPLQLEKQWITIGWALEGAALAWLLGRVPHRGLLWTACALFGAVFVRLAANPAVFEYAPRAAAPILNWYLYTYAVSAASFLAGARWLAKHGAALGRGLPAPAPLLHAAAGLLLFLLMNIEIADFFGEGPLLEFRFGAAIAQDLTYTIGWLLFGLALLAIGIATGRRPTRVASLLLVTVTVMKCFLYDLSSLGGLYRIASFAGLAVSLALVSLALQKYVLAPRNEQS